MEKIKLYKNDNVLGEYFVSETKDYEPTDLVPCSKTPDGIAIAAFQANYIANGTHV